MKILLVILTLFIQTLCKGQNTDSVFLRWKIEPNETITYLVTLQQNVLSPKKSDTSQASINIKDIFYGAKESYSGTDTVICNLTKKRNNIISIDWITYNESIRPTGADTSTAPIWMKSNSGDTVLLGSVYDNGTIHSFYSTQIDYLAFYFQLPNKKIKVGDNWPVDFNCIYFNEGFICDSAYKLNSVTLSDIKRINNEMIAIITYDLIEYVSGNDGGFFGKKQNILMEFRHKAIGEFSITKGKWLSYKGTQETISIGTMSSRTKSKVSMTLKK
jgi:hypothetical protein